MPDVVIDANYEVRWREPVWVRIGQGVPESIKGPKQALSYLTFRWPELEGDHVQQALQQCRRVLRKEAECDVARAAFVRAAREANVIL